MGLVESFGEILTWRLLGAPLERCSEWLLPPPPPAAHQPISFLALLVPRQTRLGKLSFLLDGHQANCNQRDHLGDLYPYLYRFPGHFPVCTAAALLLLAWCASPERHFKFLNLPFCSLPLGKAMTTILFLLLAKRLLARARVFLAVVARFLVDSAALSPCSDLACLQGDHHRHRRCLPGIARTEIPSWQSGDEPGGGSGCESQLVIQQ